MFSPQNVKKYQDKLNKTKTPANDKIHPHVIKEASSRFALMLSNLFTESFETGLLPNDWKEADDNKLIRVIKSAEDLKKLHIDIYKIVHWADSWKMRFNYKICKLMVIGSRKLMDQAIKLTMNTSSGEEHYLAESAEEMDLCLRRLQRP